MNHSDYIPTENTAHIRKNTRVRLQEYVILFSQHVVQHQASHKSSSATRAASFGARDMSAEPGQAIDAREQASTLVWNAYRLFHRNAPGGKARRLLGSPDEP